MYRGCVIKTFDSLMEIARGVFMELVPSSK